MVRRDEGSSDNEEGQQQILGAKLVSPKDPRYGKSQQNSPLIASPLRWGWGVKAVPLRKKEHYLKTKKSFDGH